MGMSKQTTFTLTFLVGLSVLVPGSAGYLSAKMDAVQRAYRDLLSLESRLHQERLLASVTQAPEVQTIAVPAIPCEIPPLPPTKRRKPHALIPVPVEVPPREAPSAWPEPAEGLRIEPLPAEPGPSELSEPEGSRSGGRPTLAEDERGSGRQDRRERTIVSEQNLDGQNSEQNLVEEQPLPSGSLRRIPSRSGGVTTGQETGHSPEQGTGRLGPEQGTGHSPGQSAGRTTSEQAGDHSPPEQSVAGPGSDPGQTEAPTN